MVSWSEVVRSDQNKRVAPGPSPEGHSGPGPPKHSWLLSRTHGAGRQATRGHPASRQARREIGMGENLQHGNREAVHHALPEYGQCRLSFSVFGHGLAGLEELDRLPIPRCAVDLAISRLRRPNRVLFRFRRRRATCIARFWPQCGPLFRAAWWTPSFSSSPLCLAVCCLVRNQAR